MTRFLPILIALLVVACTPSGPSSSSGSDAPATDGLPTSAWSLRRGAPLPLTEVAAAAFGGHLWVAGGYAADGTAVPDVQVYDPDLDSWSAGPPLPEPVHHAALVSTGDRLYLLGGYLRPDGTPTDAVRVLDPATGAWSDGPSLPEPRAAGAAAFDGTRIVYGGGVGPSGVSDAVVALLGSTWSSVGALSEAREHLAAAGSDGTVWFLGGRTAGLDTNLGTVDLVTGSAVTAGAPLPTARGGIAGFSAPGTGACAAGGEGPGGTFSEVECIGPDGEATDLPDLAEARHGIGAVVLDGTAYVLLGGPEPGLTVSDSLQALRLPAG